MKINFLWTACLIAITGCDSPQNYHSRIESGETKTEKQLENLNFYGTYEGILPAADCEGIRTALTLNNDNTYVLKRIHRRKRRYFRIKRLLPFHQWPPD